MNDNTECSIDVLARMEMAEAIHGESCIKARKMRMFLAANPGATAPEIHSGTGIYTDAYLFFLLKQGLVKFTNQLEEGKRVRRWYVVPQ